MSFPRIKKKSPEIKRLKRKYFRQYNLLLGSQGLGGSLTTGDGGRPRESSRTT